VRPPPLTAGGHAPVLVFAGLDWWYHNRAHSDFQLATRLARSHRVLLVNSIGTRMPRPGRTTGVAGRLRRKLRSVTRGVRRPVADLPGFHVYSPVSVPAYGSPLGRHLNERLVRGQVRVVLWWLRMPRPVVLLTPPTAWSVVSRLRRRRVLVNRSDKHSAWSEVDAQHMQALEQQMLGGADVVLYVARSLMAEDTPCVGDRAVFLDHGVEAGWFAGPRAEPSELAALPRPRIGFVGTMRDHTVDLDLLRRVAQEVPEASLVLVGPVFMDLQGLDALPNVHVVGARPHAEIPAWCAGLDVALMPWLDNEWIRACNPIKMKEYLALGLRTVSTDFPEARRYADVLDLAASADDFVALVRAAVADPRPQDADRRRAAVAGDTWDARVAELEQLITEPVPAP
jgi:glycosyltransferase involved in cell wall biosynthesis